MGKSLRVLFVSSELPPETGWGGIGTYVHHLAPSLAARGHSVTVLSSTMGPRDVREIVAGVRIVRLARRTAPAEFWNPHFPARGASLARVFYDRAYTVASVLRDDREIAQADVVEAPEWGGEAALVRREIVDAPLVVKFHTPARLVFSWNGVGVSAEFVDALHALERAATANASGFSCPSRWMIPEVERVFDMPAGTVEPIPNPYVTTPPLPRTPQQTVLYVGRLEARKGLLEAVAPMVRVLRAVPGLRWRLAGSDTASGPGGASMKATLEEQIPRDLHARIEFLGPVSREALSLEFANAGVVLLPSRRENFPYTCLEAMAAGAPVVGSRRGGMAEMIESGRTGLLVDPADPDEVVDAVMQFLLNPSFARALGEAAARDVRERFGPERITPLVEAHYRSAIESWSAS